MLFANRLQQRLALHKSRGGRQAFKPLPAPR